MSADIHIDHAEVMRAAAALRASVVSTSSSYPGISNCGSPLVADTVELFVTHFVKSLEQADADIVKVADAIRETAEDFADIEAEYEAALSTLADTVTELMPDE